jgi:ABC-type glycerol-3-phosphate transport system permease component
LAAAGAQRAIQRRTAPWRVSLRLSFLLDVHALDAEHTTDFQLAATIHTGDSLVTNYQNIFAIIPFWRNFANSAFVGITHTMLALLFCSMGGYAFAMYRFPGRNWLFALLLATMMIPWMAGIVPWFILISKWLHWINRYEALIIPGAASAFGIFWMRQYIQESIPTELLDAARIDGCHEFSIFFPYHHPIADAGLRCAWHHDLHRELERLPGAAAGDARKDDVHAARSALACCARIRAAASMPACSCWARRWQRCPC